MHFFEFKDDFNNKVASIEIYTTNVFSNRVLLVFMLQWPIFLKFTTKYRHWTT